MDTSPGKHLFQKRHERIDWRKLAAVDVEKIARDVDVDTIQDNIVNVTYCNVEHELGGYHELDGNVIKLFRLAQLTIEYLLHSQEFLQQCLSDKDRKVEELNDELNASLSQCSEVNDELSKRNDSYKDLKKELQKAKKLIGDYQFMVRSGASGLYKCVSCTKTFVSEYYLKSHVERRHSANRQHESAKDVSLQLPNTSVIQDELLNELNGIKSRLKTTEDDLKREKENVYQLNVKEVERNRELLEILRIQKLQKNEEQERIKADMEGYKNMMMKELKETQKENENLRRTLSNLQESTSNWRKSALGNLEDDDDGNTVYTDFASQVKELTKQLMETSRERDALVDKVEKWKSANKELVSDEQKYVELRSKVQKIEMHFQKEFDNLSSKYNDEVAEAKEFCKESVKNIDRRNDLTSLYAFDVVDAKKPLMNPRSVDVEVDGVNLWVSSNSTINNCYRVSQKPASSKGDWIDVFSFRALLAPSELFGRAIYVYSCAGSPYWRQYISLIDQLPAPSYKKEFTFYASATKLTDSIKLSILDTGSSSVIRSMLSKKENLEGWKGKGEDFYAFIPKSSMNRSGTFNSDVFRSVSDDEVSLSSLTGTDVVRDNLAESLKMSREDILNNEEEVVKDESIEVSKVENEESERFVGTSSTSFLGGTLPEKGEFYPFPRNMLAVARYDHTPNMINAQREELISILNEILVKRGVDVDEGHMPSRMFNSKMRNHEKELQQIENQNPGSLERRKETLKAIEEYAAKEFVRTKEGRYSSKWKSAGNVVKTAVRFSDGIAPSKLETPQEQFNYEEDSADSESSSEWNSEELDKQTVQDQQQTWDAVLTTNLDDSYDSYISSTEKGPTGKEFKTAASFGSTLSSMDSAKMGTGAVGSHI